MGKTADIPQNVRRILLVKPSSLGDILHVFPAIEMLHRRYPEAKLDFLVAPAFQQILAFSPVPIDGVILFERKKLGRCGTFLPEMCKLIRNLRKAEYDLVIDFQGLFRSGFFAWIARGKTVAGFAGSRERSALFFYDVRISSKSVHAVERNCDLAEALGGIRSDAETVLPESETFQRELRQLFPELPDRLIAVVPGARWESKCFPPELFAAVIRELHAAHPEWAFVAVGSGKSDENSCRTIRELLPENVVFLSAAGRTSVGSMVELLRKCDAVLTNDSGPAHVGAALQLPVFTFFGPTCPEKTRPYGENCYYFQRSGLSCLRCMKRLCPETGIPCHDLDVPEIVRKMNEVIFHRKDAVR